MAFDYDRVQRRVEAMSEGEMLTWLSSAIPGMQRHLEAYERSRNADHLGELAIAELTANVVITELMNRKFPKPHRHVEELVSETVERPVRSVQYEPLPATITNDVPRRLFKGRRARTGTVNVPLEDMMKEE